MPEQETLVELELRDYLRVLARRKWPIVLAVAMVVGSALAASFLQTPVYQGTARLLLQPRATESLFDPNSGQRNDPVRAIETEIQVLKSQPVQEAVEERLGAVPSISAHPVGRTDVLEVRARSTDPEQAALVANTYARAYIDFRRKQAVDDLLAAGQEIQAKVDGLQAQIDSLTEQLDSADAKSRSDVEARVRPQRDSLLSQQALFKQKLDQVQVDAALKTGGAQLVTPASTPAEPVEPRPKRTGAIALVVGLMFGVGLAFLFDYLDDSIRTKEDLERVLPGLPVLGLIPGVPAWKDREEPRLISLTEPSSPVAEAYRSLRTSVQFLGLDHAFGAVVVTSPSAGEGKTTTLANLAVALARAGKEVVVVCCDLRRPRVHEFFGLFNTVGFTSVLLGDVPLARALQSVRGTERLRLMASGPTPPNPSELLASERTGEVIAALRGQADIVLFDAPPVLPVTDAAVLSRRMDATLLVVATNVTTRKHAARATELLRQVDAPLVGTVLNGVAREGSYGYGYGYYRHEPSSRPAHLASRRGDERVMRV